MDIFKEDLEILDTAGHLIMSSESLDFIFLNTFGFDTLTVNGCFEEESAGGFKRAAKTLAIENLNNIGVKFSISILLRFDLIFLFLGRLSKVAKKVN